MSADTGAPSSLSIPEAQTSRATPPQPVRVNTEIAARLEEVADILTEQHANPYRINAYRRAAAAIRYWPTSVAELARERGVDGLDEIPAIGERLAQAVYRLATSGRLPMLERLRGEREPVEVFSSILGIGGTTARRIHEELGISTLEELEIAAYDGRLQRLGVGAKRLAGIRETLASRLGRIGRSAVVPSAPLPSVAEILDVDREYLTGAADNSLPRIAPRRLNPSRKAWLPVLHTERGDRHYTALFSNTARAHELSRTRDWVVLYFDGKGGERQCTVVTATRGPMQGRRIVRGREEECFQHYSQPPGGRTQTGFSSRLETHEHR